MRTMIARWTGVGVHAAAVVATTLTLALGHPAATLIAGGLLCTATYLALGVVESRRASLKLSPLSFYLLWYSFGLGVSAVFEGTVIATGEGLPFSIAIVPPEDLALGYVIYLVGSVALHAGLQVLRPVARDSDANAAAVHTAGFAALTVTWMIGLLASWTPWITRLGAFGAALRWGSLAAVSTLALVEPERYRLSRGLHGTLVLAGVAGLFAINLTSYSKAYLMLSFLPLVWLCVVRLSLRRWLPVLAGVLTVFYFTVVAPVVTMARFAPLEESETPGERLVSTFESWLRTAPDLIDGSFYREQAEALLVRQFDPTAVGYLVGEVDSYGFQYGATMEYAKYALIPRLLWPSKPTVTRGAWFNAYTGFAHSEEEATASTGITATGELYWNFGLPGVVLGMWGIGLLLGGLWRMAGDSPHREPFHMMLYVLLMLNMPNMSEAVTVLVSIVATFVMFRGIFLAVALLRRREEGGRAAVA